MESGKKGERKRFSKCSKDFFGGGVGLANVLITECLRHRTTFFVFMFSKVNVNVRCAVSKTWA